MKFHLSPEQVAIQEAVAGVLADRWTLERMHGFAAGTDDVDRDLWRALMELGIGGLMLAEADGGAGLGLLEAALVCEAAGAAAAPGPIAGQIMTAAAIARSGNAAARVHLAAVTAGEKVATLALSGDLVEAGRSADLFLVEEGGALLLVERGEGLVVEAVRSTDRSRPLSRVSFGDAARQELFPAGDPMVQRVQDAALVLVAADALGGATRVTEMSVAYAKERTQFGQPIGRFQGLKHQLAHMALDVEPARALVWYAAYAWDARLPDVTRSAALAKAHLCDVYTRATRAAVAAHGGIGYTWEYGLNYWFRRSVANRVWLGSPAEHRARAAALAGW